MIEYVEIMTQGDLDKFFGSILKKNTLNKSQAIDYLKLNEETVIKEYECYKTKCVEEYYAQKKEIAALQEAWSKKTCAVCSSKLRIVDWDYGSFWGCPKFSDGRVHTKFSEDYESQLAAKWSNCYVRVKSYWLTDIIKLLKLPQYIKATDLLNFYESIGLEDLREKYGYKNTKESIGGRAKAKQASLQEEREITNFLNPFFKKTQKQLGIRYKLATQKESVAILDLIVSDEETVNIIEIKRTILDVVDGQLELYKSLISFVLNSKEDRRKIVAVFIVYDDIKIYFTIDTPFVAFNSIKQLQTKDEILNQFSVHQID